jgi:hypothetical protein
VAPRGNVVWHLWHVQVQRGGIGGGEGGVGGREELRVEAKVDNDDGVVEGEGVKLIGGDLGRHGVVGETGDLGESGNWRGEMKMERGCGTVIVS